MVVVDSSAWIAFWRTRESALSLRVDEALSRTPVVVGDLVLTEVLQGLRLHEVELVTSAMSVFRFEVLGSYDIAIKAAANYRTLRQRGITVRGTIDVVIATWCIENDVPIIHNDRDMAVMERELGLRAYT